MQIIRGYRKIAEYLGISTRTLKLWVKHRELPIHYHDGKRKRVFALEDELTEYLKSRPLLNGKG
jgi:excisionase family DNA binding protein